MYWKFHSNISTNNEMTSDQLHWLTWHAAHAWRQKPTSKRQDQRFPQSTSKLFVNLFKQIILIIAYKHLKHFSFHWSSSDLNDRHLADFKFFTRWLLVGRYKYFYYVIIIHCHTFCRPFTYDSVSCILKILPSGTQPTI